MILLPLHPAPVRLLGDPILRTPATPVTRFGTELHRLVERLFAAMYAADGVGLAANQLGVGLRVFVYDLRDGRAGHLVNSSLVLAAGGEDVVELEGCLSLPGRHDPTPRRPAVTALGVDLRGRQLKIKASGLLARCLQHEVDHLDGRLYVDRLSPALRRAALAATVVPDHEYLIEPSRRQR